MPWRPGQHAEAVELEQPYEDVPPHLASVLWQWIVDPLRNSDELLQVVGLYLRLPMPDATSGPSAHGSALDKLASLVNEQPTLRLDLVEAVLRATSDDYRYRSHLEALEPLLAIGHSAYRVRDDFTALEMRIMPETRDAVAAAVDAGSARGSSGAHLAAAWNAAFGRSSRDPVKAYSEAIKAVEAAAAPVVSPKNLKATLGTMIGEMAANTSSFEVSITSTTVDPVEVVIGDLRLLWTGQTSRHGGVGPTVAETAESAQAAVHLAAALVQMFVSGGIKRR
ncbi:MAG: hypothetical protein ACJ735_02595 [Actinomycetes bacterium]